MILLCTLALILATPLDDPASVAWAAGLASSIAQERHATIDAIEARGLAALPSLRAIAATGVGEVRTRAIELIERIGSRRLLRATPVSFDEGDRTVGEAVAHLSNATRFAIDLEPTPEVSSGRRVTLGGGPIGFFEAVDRLAAEGRLRHDPSPSFSVRPKSGVRIRLFPRDGEMPPSSYAGPYKVAINVLERHREVAQARPPAEAVVREDFSVVLDIIAEPGILIDRNGPIQLHEATDERGRDLRAASSQDSNPAATMYRQWAQDSLGTFTYRLPLKLPTERGRTIARLRGFVPITAIARTDELFSTPIDGIEGKTITGGGVSLRVTRAALTGGTGLLEVTIKGEPPPDVQAYAAGPRQTTLATLHLGLNPDDHLRIEDANGIPFTTSTTGTAPASPDGSANFRVTIFAGRATGRPTTLRYFGIAGVATEVPFDFRDLVIP